MGECILRFMGTFHLFFKCVALRSSCGRMKLRVKEKTVWFDGEEAHRHSLVSNTPLQAGASGFTAPSRAL